MNIIEEALGIVNNVWPIENLRPLTTNKGGPGTSSSSGPNPQLVSDEPESTDKKNGKPEDGKVKPTKEPGKVPPAAKGPPVKRPNPRNPKNVEIVTLTPEQIKEIKESVKEMISKSDKHIYEKIPGKEDKEQQPDGSKSDIYRARTEEQERGRGGEGHGTCERVWKEMLKSKLDWKEHLKDFVTTLVKRTEPDRGKFKKRPLVHDEFRFKRKKIYGAKILVCVDTSGSISAGDYNKFMSELFTIYTDYGEEYDVEIKLIYWDTEVSEVPGTFNRQNYEDILKYPSQKTGGNRVTCVLEWILKNKDEREPDGIVYFTDGYEEPSPRLYPADHSLLILAFNGTPEIMGPFVDEVVYLDDGYGGKR